MLRAAGIRPYGLTCTIQCTLNKEPRAVSPLQSALRAASFPREGSFWRWPQPATIQCTALFRHIAERQVAAPYEAAPPPEKMC